jgi:2-methylcitrate dehydratase
VDNNHRPAFDKLITDIARYALSDFTPSDLALDTARWVVLDSYACALKAHAFPACTKLLGPIVPGATLKKGARVIGTNWELDPVQAAFNNGALIRWLDFNDTWLAAEWGHPSDNLGGILALMDYLQRCEKYQFTTEDLLMACIKAHEIQGIMALDNSFNAVGLDHVALVKLATTAVCCSLLELDFDTTCSAISQVFVDGQALRTYRHAPNAGSRKSWAAGDASSRGVRLALLSRTGEMGYPSAISAKTWGFEDVSMRGHKLSFSQPLGCYVMENILFKISFPAEFHGQTAVEAAIELHQQHGDQLSDIKEIQIETQASGNRIINKSGPLHNPADRDHSLQYMIAVGLIEGRLEATHYENTYHQQTPLIDELREKMQVTENESYSSDYLNPNKRSIANSIELVFNDGTHSEKIETHFPVGHRMRRDEGFPLLEQKLCRAIKEFMGKKAEKHSVALKASLADLTASADPLFKLLARTAAE